MKKLLTKWAIRLLAYLVIGSAWGEFLKVSAEVADDPRIPIYGKDQFRFGREARRDEAVHRAGYTNLSDSQINLGCELAYWWRKLN